MELKELKELKAVLRQFWGYEGFLPLQEEAMQCVLGGNDSLVVLPTGGGKSLCYQVPALCLPGMAIIVSPLIALMKDQVDGLRECGVPAVAINSSLSPLDRRMISDQVRRGEVKLLYIAPERLMQERTVEFLRSVPISFVAIDEAHCISEWGHDFRPEYRELRQLRTLFPQVGVHAYTATATDRVRQDVADQLLLRNPRRLIGSFDRKNLLYRVQRRSGVLSQIRAVMDRHQGESGIIYCTTRADTESTCQALTEYGYSILPYHAGMSDEDRRKNQDAFIEDRVTTIAATVAFGMGIDKPNVRYVIHSGMPKSLENYQQESGRAGRDGLEAECMMIYSPGDIVRWRRMSEESDPGVGQAQRASLEAMYDFCTRPVCRHQTLLRYFGQEPVDAPCNACDVCLSELDLVDDALIVGQKILSSVIRQEQRFGGDYTALVLIGSEDQRIVQNGHDRLSTYGLLREESHRTVRDWVEQLVGQNFLEKVGEYNVLQVTTKGRELLRGKATPRLVRPPERRPAAKRRSVVEDSWEGVDRGLFERLRAVRLALAKSRNVPPYVVFGDVTLREMARRFPKTPVEFRKIRGVGDKKSSEFADDFLACIREYCGVKVTDSLRVESKENVEYQEGVRGQRTRSVSAEASLASLSGGAVLALPYFRAGKSVQEVAAALGRALSTTAKYLLECLAFDVMVDWSPWVPEENAQRILEAVQQHSNRQAKPIFEALGGQVPYEQIHIVLACHRNRGEFAELS